MQRYTPKGCFLAYPQSVHTIRQDDQRRHRLQHRMPDSTRWNGLCKHSLRHPRVDAGIPMGRILRGTQSIFPSYHATQSQRAMASSNLKKTANDWLQILMTGAVQVDDVPPGWFTIEQISEITGKSVSHVQKGMRAARGAGLYEMKTFRIRTGKRTYPTDHFKLL